METINTNRKAKFNYNIIDTYICGIVLFGDEVVSLRNKNTSISESFCYIHDGECFIKNMYIKRGDNLMFRVADETRDRKLLLHKKEINKIDELISKDGYTIIPLRVLKIKNLYKIEIGVAKGKKLYDKRETIKERDIQRDLDIQMKQY